jgi:glucose/arabinose dehydrogenase
MRGTLLFLLLLPAAAASADTALTGTAAYGGWRTAAPGVERHITVDSMPPPHASRSAHNGPATIARPPGARLHVPPGFTVQEFAAGLEQPRTIAVAPNGDIFVAESGAGAVRVFRAADGTAQPTQQAVFARGLDRPFGLAFWPPGPEPRFLYVAETNRVVRFAYQPGVLSAAGPAQTVVPHLPAGGHWTRDLVFSADGSRMFVSVGSASNAGTELAGPPPRAEPMPGAGWGDEQDRADVLAFAPEGGGKRIFATGLRNCSAEAVQPGTGALWCVVNERDGLGDDLPPDYATAVRQGAFYGWPWYYIGAHPDPRLHGAPPGLAAQVVTPDVLIEPHSAPLGIAFYTGAQFPADYRGDAFVALHGSWNRAERTGYKVIRLRFAHGRPTGAYQDFLTGFVASDRAVWGRPVGVAVLHDGSLLVSEDGNGTLWHIGYAGGTP